MEKHIHIILAAATLLAAMSAVSCEKETPEPYTYTPTTTQQPKQETPATKTYSFSVGTLPASFGEGEAVTISIKLDTDAPDSEIEVHSVPGWMTATVSGSVLTLDITENDTFECRSAQLLVYPKGNQGKAVRIYVTQDWHMVNAEGMVQFKDRNFKKGCLQAADADGDGDVSPAEALAVSELVLVRQEIKDITGIEAFKNLEKLDLRNNFIEDGTLIADHPKLHWVDLSGNSSMKTWDIRGCSFYFTHFDFDLNQDLQYHRWHRQSTVEKSKHLTKGMDLTDKANVYVEKNVTTDWSRHGQLVPMHLHTKGDGTKKMVFTGLGYINSDLESGMYDLFMHDLFDALIELYPKVAERIDYFDVYYMEYLSEDTDGLLYTYKSYTGEDGLEYTNPEYYYLVKKYWAEQFELEKVVWCVLTGEDRAQFEKKHMSTLPLIRQEKYEQPIDLVLFSFNIPVMPNIGGTNWMSEKIAETSNIKACIGYHNVTFGRILENGMFGGYSTGDIDAKRILVNGVMEWYNEYMDEIFD